MKNWLGQKWVKIIIGVCRGIEIEIDRNVICLKVHLMVFDIYEQYKRSWGLLGC